MRSMKTLLRLLGAVTLSGLSVTVVTDRPIDNYFLNILIKFDTCYFLLALSNISSDNKEVINF